MFIKFHYKTYLNIMEKSGGSLKEKLHLILLFVFIILVYYLMIFEPFIVNSE